ncbi:serine hydrolase domain-containing protein [Planctomicrobium sp. SH661]|uniref:serine hydrolase domain-containing protein n=1 Tax=Planctomicrobium sp. SH661 TaxID=3448124 RepID=UPI003F5B332C
MSSYELQTALPAEMGLHPERWRKVLEAADELCRNKALPALSLQVQKRGLTTGAHHFGSRLLDRPEVITDDTLFLIASLTKPMVSAAVMLLVERGKISLSEPVGQYFPEIKDPAKRPLTIKHLLTHTSGLPDMLPNNAELREANAPLSVFLEETCATELLFPPGRSAQYQSMGFVLLGSIIEKVTGLSCRDFVHQELFRPLNMQNAWLGLPAGESELAIIAEVELPSSQRIASGWNWNSAYWRELGAPWGGVLTTASDTSRFLRMMLAGDVEDNLLSAASRRESLENRLDDYPAIPDSERRSRGWGLAWRLNWKDHRSSFCDILSGEVAGHWGATGTLFWVDRQREIGVVLLSTRSMGEGVSPLTHLSNMIAAAFVEED